MSQSVPTKIESVPTTKESVKTSIETVIENKTHSSSSCGDRFRDYRVVKQLPTRGAESDICIVAKDESEYILKLYRLGIKPKKEMLDKLQKLSRKCPNEVVQIYESGFDEATKRWFEIQEYIENGSLREFEGKIDTKELIREINNILKALHSNDIVHRDIKPENILLRSVEPLDLVITDFGISSLLDGMENIFTTLHGTYRYFAPESFSKVIGREVDYWALGMIVYESIREQHYFEGILEHIIQLKITTGFIDIDPEYFDEEFQLLLKSLLCQDPKKRWGYIEVKKWLEGEEVKGCRDGVCNLSHL